MQICIVLIYVFVLMHVSVYMNYPQGTLTCKIKLICAHNCTQYTFKHATHLALRPPC